jgi:hypothetical protein
MFIEVMLEDGKKILIRIEDIFSVEEKKTSSYNTKIIMIDNRYYHVKTPYEKIKDLINKAMQL